MEPHELIAKVDTSDWDHPTRCRVAVAEQRGR